MRCLRGIIHSALVWLFLPLPLFAQQTVKPSDNYLVSIERIPLPSLGRVNAIVRDDLGFLWFGTKSGLCRYDGYEVRVFKNGSGADSLQGMIWAMTKSPDGSLLLATWNGLWTFNIKTERFAPFLSSERLGSSRIDALAEDSNGTVWIGGRSGGLFKYDRSTQGIKRYTTKEGLSNTNISALLIDHAGVLWIGTGYGGLNSLHPTTSRITHYRYDSSNTAPLPSNYIRCLDENNNGEIWMGTNDGVSILDPKTGSMRRSPLGGAGWVRTIAHDPSGRMWIGKSTDGLFSYLNGAMSHFQPSVENPNTLSDALIRTMYVDPISSNATRVLVFVGTLGGVVNKIRLTRNPFSNSMRNENSLLLGKGAVLAISEDRRGIVWVGLWGGGLNALMRVNGIYRRIAHYQTDPHNQFSLPNDKVNAILEDRERVLWVGTDDGLAALDRHRKTFLIYRHENSDSASIAGNNINEIYEDRWGRLWVGTDAGLSLLIRDGEKHHFKNYLHSLKDAHETGGNAVTDIIEDRSGNLWVSMRGGGLNRLNDSGQFTRFLHAKDTSGRLENWIENIHEDVDGIFWMSARASRLVTFDPRSGVFARYNAEQLGEEHVYAIENGGLGNLLLSTTKGLFRLNPKTHNFIRHTNAEGFPFSELTSGFFRNENGKVFVGGSMGFTEFSPESIYTPTTPPTIALTGFSIFDKPMPATMFAVIDPPKAGEIKLEYNQNFFSFSFAVLDYVDPGRNRYSYRMIGLDSVWTRAGNRTLASYTNLDPGEYVFQVKGSTSDGVWNEQGTFINITITPPWWKTVWAYGSYGALVIMGLYSLRRYEKKRDQLKQQAELERVESEKRLQQEFSKQLIETQEAERKRVASELHDSLGQHLLIVNNELQLSLQGKQFVEADVLRTVSVVKDAIKEVREIASNLHPHHLEKLGLRPAVEAMIEQISRSATVKFDAAIADVDDKLNMQAKINLYRVLQEAIANIVRHSGATQARITISQTNDNVQTLIEDNGKGFTSGASQGGRQGFGLKSMTERINLCGGTITFDSSPGKGTTIHIVIPR